MIETFSAGSMTVTKLSSGKVLVETRCAFKDGAEEEEVIDLSVIISISPGATLDDTQRTALLRASELLRQLAD